MKHLFMGIDLGTSAMKLLLMNEKKEVIASQVEGYQVASFKQGWCEIDPNIWLACLKAGMRKLLANVDGRMIRSIGVTGQMHTLVMLDKEGNSVRPAIMWNDTRAKELLPELKEQIAEFEEGEYLGKTISTGSPAANLYWLKKYEKKSFDKINKFMIAPDYLVYCLTGHVGTDYCEASTSCLFLLNKGEWSEQMRMLLGLEKEMYPEIRGSAVAAGKIRKDFADEFGINEDADILTGTGDNPAAALSTGCLGEGYPVISLGTSGVLMLPVKKMENRMAGKAILFSVDGTQFSYLMQGAVQSNGSTVDWWIQRILDKGDYSDIDKMFEKGRPIQSELLFYPHLSGDKTIYADPNLRGAFLGISQETSSEDITYAVIEGLCFAMRELAEKMNFSYGEGGKIKVIGGGTKSQLWMQTMADVFGVCVEQLDGMIGPSYGMALLAAYQAGYIKSIQCLANSTIQVKKCFEPEEEAVKLYEKKYRRYLRIYKGIRYIYNEENL